MSEIDTSRGRRPVLPLLFEPRAERSEKLWRRIFMYYARHAERVWWRADLRDAVRLQLKGAKGEVTSRLIAFDPAVLRAYVDKPPVASIQVHARFPETVEYVELFAIADRVFVALHHPAILATMNAHQSHAVRAHVSQALRRPAQVVAETPGLRRVDLVVASEAAAQAFPTASRTDGG